MARHLKRPWPAGAFDWQTVERDRHFRDPFLLANPHLAVCAALVSFIRRQSFPWIIGVIHNSIGVETDLHAATGFAGRCGKVEFHAVILPHHAIMLHDILAELVDERLLTDHREVDVRFGGGEQGAGLHPVGFRNGHALERTEGGNHQGILPARITQVAVQHRRFRSDRQMIARNLLRPSRRHTQRQDYAR